MIGCSTQMRDGHAVVALSGEVDLSWSAQVRKAVLDALGRGGPVAVDLSAVEYIDSSGIAALIEGFQLARGKRQRFVLLAPAAPVLAVLRLARLDKVFPIVDQLDAED